MSFAQTSLISRPHPSHEPMPLLSLNNEPIQLIPPSTRYLEPRPSPRLSHSTVCMRQPILIAPLHSTNSLPASLLLPNPNLPHTVTYTKSLRIPPYTRVEIPFSHQLSSTSQIQTGSPLPLSISKSLPHPCHSKVGRLLPSSKPPKTTAATLSSNHFCC